MDSVRKLLAGERHEAVALCLLLSLVLGGLGQTLHKALTQRFGATATRLLTNLQAVVAWVIAVALFYALRDDPVFGGVGEGRGGEVMHVCGERGSRGEGGRRGWASLVLFEMRFTGQKHAGEVFAATLSSRSYRW